MCMNMRQRHKSRAPLVLLEKVDYVSIEVLLHAPRGMQRQQLFYQAVMSGGIRYVCL